MKKYKIKITSLAEHDLENIGDYISYDLNNPISAANLINGIKKQINSLTNFPERNEIENDDVLAKLGVRKEYYKNYKIYYVVDADTIYIIRILHMLVNSPTWLYHIFEI